MTRDELNKNLCAVITTLDEVGWSVESTLYIALGCDMETWETVKTILVSSHLATVESYRVTITPTGHAMAVKINAFMAR